MVQSTQMMHFNDMGSGSNSRIVYFTPTGNETRDFPPIDRSLRVNYGVDLFAFAHKHADLSVAKKRYSELVQQYLSQEIVPFSEKEIEIRKAVVELFSYTLFSSEPLKIPSTLSIDEENGIYLRHDLCHGTNADIAERFIAEFFELVGNEIFQTVRNALKSTMEDHEDEFKELVVKYVSETDVFRFLNTLGLQLDVEEIPISPTERQFELTRERARQHARLTANGRTIDGNTAGLINRGVVRRDMQLDDETARSNIKHTLDPSADFPGAFRAFVIDLVLDLVVDMTKAKKSEFKVDFDYRNDTAYVTHRSNAEYEVFLGNIRTDFNVLMDDFFYVSDEVQTMYYPTEPLVGISPNDVLGFTSLEDLYADRFRKAEPFDSFLKMHINLTQLLLAAQGIESVLYKPNSRLIVQYYKWENVKNNRYLNYIGGKAGYISQGLAQTASNIVDRFQYLDEHGQHIGEVVGIDESSQFGTTLLLLHESDTLEPVIEYSGQNYQLSIQLQGIGNSGLVPNVAGYRLIAKSDDLYFFERDPEYIQKNLDVVDMEKSYIRSNLKKTIRILNKMGATELAEALSQLRSHSGITRRDPILITEIQAAVANSSIYSFDQSLSVGQATKLKDFGSCVVEGKLNFQCTGANLFLGQLLKSIDPGLDIEFITGNVIDSASTSIRASSHQMLQIKTSKGTSFLDATPSLAVSRDSTDKPADFSVDEQIAGAPKTTIVRQAEIPTVKDFNNRVQSSLDDMDSFIDRISKNVKKPGESTRAYTLRRRDSIKYDPVSRAHLALGRLNGLINDKSGGIKLDSEEILSNFRSACTMLENYSSNDTFFHKHPDVKKVNPNIVENLLSIMTPINETLALHPDLVAFSIPQSPITDFTMPTL